MASVQGIEKIIEIRSRVKQLEAQLKHLRRSQTELSNFLQEEPGDKDFIQAVEENDFIIKGKDALLIHLIQELKLLDPTFEHYADSFLEPETDNAASGGSNMEGNERERVGICNGGEEEEDGDDVDDGEFDSVSEFANRQALASSTGSIDMQQITSSMESIFDECNNKLISVSCREGDNISSDSSSNGINTSCYNGSNSNGSSNSSSSNEGVYL